MTGLESPSERHGTAGHRPPGEDRVAREAEIRRGSSEDPSRLRPSEPGPLGRLLRRLRGR